MIRTSTKKTHTDQSGKPGIASSAPIALTLAPMIPTQRPNWPPAQIEKAAISCTSAITTMTHPIVLRSPST